VSVTVKLRSGDEWVVKNQTTIETFIAAVSDAVVHTRSTAATFIEVYPTPRGAGVRRSYVPFDAIESVHERR
jgi:hypothetical protein